MPDNIFFFEWEEHKDENVTVVALNDKLNYFRAQPIMIDGKPMEKFNEKMVKDCRNIDGCIYMHRDKIPEYKMNDLIGKFQKVKKELGDKWKPTGRITVKDNSIII